MAGVRGNRIPATAGKLLNDSNAPEWLRVRELAKFLSVSPLTIKRKIKKGLWKVKKEKPGHCGRWLINRVSIQEWLNTLDVK